MRLLDGVSMLSRIMTLRRPHFGYFQTEGAVILFRVLRHTTHSRFDPEDVLVSSKGNNSESNLKRTKAPQTTEPIRQSRSCARTKHEKVNDPRREKTQHQKHTPPDAAIPTSIRSNTTPVVQKPGKNHPDKTHQHFRLPHPPPFPFRRHHCHTTPKPPLSTTARAPRRTRLQPRIARPWSREAGGGARFGDSEGGGPEGEVVEYESRHCVGVRVRASFVVGRAAVVAVRS
jgi:hypothetical protein